MKKCLRIKVISVWELRNKGSEIKWEELEEFLMWGYQESLRSNTFHSNIINIFTLFPNNIQHFTRAIGVVFLRVLRENQREGI